MGGRTPCGRAGLLGFERLDSRREERVRGTRADPGVRRTEAVRLPQGARATQVVR
jgi:hypothetical protein